MRLVIQRVTSASVEVEQKVIGSIKEGLAVLVGFGKEDTENKLKPALQKLINLRIFPNKNGRFDHSLVELNAGLLLIPQFTLYADTSKGRRPEFFNALEPRKAEKLFDKFITLAKLEKDITIQQGKFGADMLVSINNKGPVTISLEI